MKYDCYITTIYGINEILQQETNESNLRDIVKIIKSNPNFFFQLRYI